LRLLLVGAPGVGKGTQAKRLSKDLGVPHISTGDMFRDAIRRQTPLGKKAKIFIDIGSLVPDDLTIGLIEERFAEDDVRKRGYILDGFPRTLPQARALDALLAKLGRPLDAVVVLDIEESMVVERISGRRTCTGCGAPYHAKYRRPLKDGVCDICSQKLAQREDDTEMKVLLRLDKYRSETQAVIPFYEARGLVRRVDGGKPADDVYAAIRAALGMR
jgi:adenylate kinase